MLQNILTWLVVAVSVGVILLFLAVVVGGVIYFGRSEYPGLNDIEQ